jgi:lysophospholipase L1-like esterase
MLSHSIRFAVLCVALVAAPVSAKDWTIVTFGDSTTAPRGKLTVYSDLLQQEFERRGVQATVLNKGVPANTTVKARVRFERDVLAHRPDLVVIQFGINDSAIDVWKDPPADAPRVDLATYAANLRHFVRTLKEQGARVVLMTPNALTWSKTTKELYGKPPFDVNDTEGFNVSLRTYLDTVRKVAKEEGTGFVDVFALYEKHGIEKAGLDLLLDGMHPNDAGQRLVFEQLLPEIDRLLKR